MTMDQGATGPQDIDIDLLAKGVAGKQQQQRQHRVISDQSLGTISEGEETQGNLLRALTTPMSTAIAPADRFAVGSVGLASASIAASRKCAIVSLSPEEYLSSGVESVNTSINASQRVKKLPPRTRTQVAFDMKQDHLRRAGSQETKLSAKVGRNFRVKAKWKMGMRIKVLSMMFIGVVFALAFLKKPKSGDWGDFGPRKTMYCGNVPNFIFIAISRLTAYAMYPCFWLLFLTKCHFLRTKTFNTQVSLYMHMEEGHHLHVYCGWWVFWMTWLHCIFHIIRWARRGDMHFIYEHQTGITGLIGWICCTIVVLPMGLRKLRLGIKWELRKSLHTVLGFTFLAAVAFHAPATNVFWFCIPALVIYGADWLYIQTFKTFLATSSHFHRLTDGVVLYFENPPGFVPPQGGYYLNLCVPFISRFQWHALTVYPHPHIPNASSVCIINNGDWSKAIHADTAYDTKRPIWVQGPFLSPYAAVLNYDNAICVASGSGITAALGALQALRDDRRVNLMWICRDASMVEFYLNTIDFDTDAFSLIFYTGKRPLACTRELPDTTLVFEERPDLRGAICMCIQMIESSAFLPESVLEGCDRRMERMKRIAEEITTLDDSLPGSVILERLLVQALTRYTPQEILAKIDTSKEHEDMKLEDMKILLQDVFNAQMSDEGCYEILEKLHCKSKLRKFCNEAMRAFMGEMSAEAVSMRPDNIKDRFSNRQGSCELKAMLSEWESEVASKRLDRWSVCYCGGSAPVNAALTKVCTDFGIDYNQEGFEW